VRTKIISVAASCALLAAPGCVPTPAGIPATVSTALFGVAEACEEVGGKPHTDGAVRRVDLTGDGREEFVLYTGWIDCEGAASIYGDREKAVMVFAGEGQGGAAEPFTEWVYEAHVDETDALAVLWLTTSGEDCGAAPAGDFANETFCARAIVWNTTAQRFEYAPVSTVRPIE
jgi:hypothetical protein